MVFLNVSLITLWSLLILKSLSTILEGEARPWGSFTVLKDESHYKLEQIQVKPGQCLSLQKHAHREEHCLMTKGDAEVTLNDDVHRVSAGQYIFIPQGAVHRITNSSNDVVEFIEVQLGSYFGEDDIIRLEDDYQREVEACVV